MADPIDREFGCVVVDADIHPARIGADVINAIGNGLAEFLVDEIMNLHLVGAALGPVVAAAILVGANQLLFLCVNRDDGVSSGLESPCLRVDAFELAIPIRMIAAILGLAVHVPREPEKPQQLADAIGASPYGPGPGAPQPA
jgi:hypothetical protein